MAIQELLQELLDLLSADKVISNPPTGGKKIKNIYLNESEKLVIVYENGTGGNGGNTIYAASPSYADVSAAITTSVTGDTVIVPAGTATWSDTLAITKGLYIIGAGIGSTIITSTAGTAVTYHPANAAVDYPFRFSGFEISGSAGIFLSQTWTDDPDIPVVSQTKIRIDHNKLTMTSTCLEIDHAQIYGVADSNILTSSGDCAMRFYGCNLSSWNNITFDFGSANQFYFEDNVCSHFEPAHAGGHGGRYCSRYNTFTYTGSAGLYPCNDFHGNQPGDICAMMGTEIYGNTYNWNGKSGTLFDGRGGKALIYNNNVVTSGGVGAKFREEYNDNINTVPSSPISGQPQHVSDCYAWGNTKNGSLLALTDYYFDGTIDYGGDIGVVPRWNVTTWRHTTPFDGTSGVGVGLLAARPSSGLTVGVGYWATDMNVLYRATGATTWETFYQPYTYPHPLRNE